MRLVLFALGVTASTALFIGLWPAIKLSRGGVQDGLKETTTGVTASVHRRLASTLIVGEVALAVVLLTGAGLLIRKLRDARARRSGIRPIERRSVAAVRLRRALPDPEQTLAFFRQILDSFGSQPGVVRAGAVSAMPFIRADIDVRRGFRVGRPAPPDDQRHVSAVATPTISTRCASRCAAAVSSPTPMARTHHQSPSSTI